MDVGLRAWRYQVDRMTVPELRAALLAGDVAADPDRRAAVTGALDALVALIVPTPRHRLAPGWRAVTGEELDSLSIIPLDAAVDSEARAAIGDCGTE